MVFCRAHSREVTYSPNVLRQFGDGIFPAETLSELYKGTDVLTPPACFVHWHHQLSVKAIPLLNVVGTIFLSFIPDGLNRPLPAEASAQGVAKRLN